jgi:hypothetical protein
LHLHLALTWQLSGSFLLIGLFKIRKKGLARTDIYVNGLFLTSNTGHFSCFWHQTQDIFANCVSGGALFTIGYFMYDYPLLPEKGVRLKLLGMDALAALNDMQEAHRLA